MAVSDVALTRTISERASALNWIATAPVARRSSKWLRQSLHLHSQHHVISNTCTKTHSQETVYTTSSGVLLSTILTI